MKESDVRACAGRGVFASEMIQKGTIVEISPVLVLTKQEVDEHASKTCLQHYTYYWPDPAGGPQTQAIALGLGSMFNHSIQRQNVIWSRDVTRGVIVYSAHRDIQPGEELCISYGSARLWFKDVEVEENSVNAEEQDPLVLSDLCAIMPIDSAESK